MIEIGQTIWYLTIDAESGRCSLKERVVRNNTDILYLELTSGDLILKTSRNIYLNKELAVQAAKVFVSPYVNELKYKITNAERELSQLKEDLNYLTEFYNKL